MRFPVVLDHPFFLGLQAHPEFCTRPLNPSTPFLGLVAAASGPGRIVFDEQLAFQRANYQPPHPEDSMVNESALKEGIPVGHGEDKVLVNGVHDLDVNGVSS